MGDCIEKVTPITKTQYINYSAGRLRDVLDMSFALLRQWPEIYM